MGTNVSEEITVSIFGVGTGCFSELFVPVYQRRYKPEAFDVNGILDMSVIPG
jgi:hypothetical protein